MSPQKTRRRRSPQTSGAFAEARDELFHHIMQCGVIESDAQHQLEWFDETMEYMAGRYHELEPAELAELRLLGERFCRPPKTHS